MSNGTYTYSPKFNENDTYSFSAKFQEFATLYRGLKRVWISDGVEGDYGFLYAEYENGFIQKLGLATEYGIAKETFEKIGEEITYEQWVQRLLDIPELAHTTIVNAQTATTKAEEATASANSANQSKQASQQAKTAAETAQSKAEQAEDNSEAWAVGQVNGTDVPSSHINYHNNSKYYSEQSEASKNTAVSAKNTAVTKANEAASSKTAAQNAQTASETAQSKAETAQSKAENAQNAAETAKSKAETAQSNAEKAEDNSEAWAVGKINGSDVPSSHVNYHNNSKYYSEQSEASKNTAVSARDSASQYASSALSSKNAAEVAKTSAETANTNAQSAKSSAESAKTAAKQAKTQAQIAKTAAETAESHAKTSEQNAKNYELNAESWAVGKRNNVDVGTTDPAYHNNSKYYSEVAYQHAESIKGVNLVISYQNSTSGTVVPTGTWNTTPSPTKGQYLWTRTVYNWTDARSSTAYTVTYVGSDGTGSVDSVNGKTGRVVLNATDITMSQSDNTSVFNMLQIATTSEIDALFN